MRTEENFPISNEIVNQFVIANSEQWKKQTNGKDIIIANFSMVRLQVAWILPKLIYARGMADATNAQVYVFTWRQNEELTQIIHSFGFEHIVIDEFIKHHFTSMMKSILETAGFMLTDGTGEGLKAWKTKGLTVGQSLYEDILRTSSLSTIKSARKKVVLKKMIHVLSYFYALDFFCKNKKICGALIDDIAYHEGSVIKLIASKKCPVIMQMNNYEKRKIIMNPADRPQTFSTFLKEYIDQKIDDIDKDTAVEWTDHFLQERFQGKNGRVIDRGAFVNKKVLTKEDFAQQFGIDTTKKTIVIMAHTFTDAVFNYGDYYFRDYYDWMEKTLQIAAGVENVNWILKPHPTRHSYNESIDSIELMFERICKDKTHMYLLPDDISGESIINIADAQVTIGGNSGGEYACFGIPTVIIGKPYYSGYGYTIEPATFEEYVDCLSDISNIERLTEKQIEKAKVVFYIRNSNEMNHHFYKYQDEFANEVNQQYNQMINEMAMAYFNSNDGTQTFNDSILKNVTEYFRTHDMHECDYYITGYFDMGKQ